MVYHNFLERFKGKKLFKNKTKKTNAIKIINFLNMRVKEKCLFFVFGNFKNKKRKNYRKEDFIIKKLIVLFLNYCR